MNLTPELTQQQRSPQGPSQDQMSVSGNQFYTDFQTSAACLANCKRMYFMLFRLPLVTVSLFGCTNTEMDMKQAQISADNLPTGRKVSSVEPLACDE